MTNLTERTLGYGFGLLGGVLTLVGALVSGVTGLVDLTLGRNFGAGASGSEAAVLLVIGALALFFSYLAYRSWSDRPIAGGVLLVVLGVLGWGALGLGTNLPALVGALFVLLGGILFLVVPLERRITHAAPA
ncbi:MAG: hypothetical protein ACREDK_06025 [Thermoplasmata archaeon]